MSMVNIIATYCGRIDHWEVFQLDGISSLNLYGGQRMVPLLDDTVTIAEEYPRHVLRIFPPRDDDYTQLEEFFGSEAFDHLDALARLNQPTTSLEELENRLQDALAAREATKYRRPELLRV